MINTLLHYYGDNVISHYCYHNSMIIDLTLLSHSTTCMCVHVCVYVCSTVYMYVCVCVCVCMCACMYSYMCVYMCTSVYMCMCMYVCIHVCVCVCVCVYHTTTWLLLANNSECNSHTLL